MKRTFELSIKELNWIKNGSGEKDFCVHGKVLLYINNELENDISNKNWSLHATGLYLLRTLEKDYEPGEYDSQLFPCCGHIILAVGNDNFVAICGCPNGEELKIEHTNDNRIKITTLKESTCEIDFELFKENVLTFTNQIEEFYRKSNPKILPTAEDDEDRIGYLTFWKEWNAIKERYNLKKNQLQYNPSKTQ